MRRTYKSKKDAAGVLDHKDVFLNMDEKSSVFDAFYIQNIKQTKKEMSCFGSTNQYGGTSNKVRKRKYVKRIVKEVEPVLRESLSNSVYITPEKSIHVKKAPDLFDQLLESSLTNQNESPRSSKVKNIKSNREYKNYTRKKTTKAKKYNYSTSESDSEKENSQETSYITKNTSDINIQKLLIEKQEPVKSNVIDQSICDMLEKLPHLNKIANQSNCSSKASYKPYRHRLTRNLNSSKMDDSPSCSTPFKMKFRSSSIYKFSPISQQLEDSPNYVSITENPDSPHEMFLRNQDYKSPIIDCIQSPILQTNKSLKSNGTIKFNSKTSSSSNSSKNSFQIDNENLGSSQRSLDTPEIVAIGEEIELETTESKPFLGFTNTTSHEELKSIAEEAIEVISNDEIQIIDKSDNKSCSELQITEAEPFLGFSHNSPVRTSKLQRLCIEDSCLLSSSNDDEVTVQEQNDISLAENDEDVIHGGDENSITSTSRNEVDGQTDISMVVSHATQGTRDDTIENGSHCDNESSQESDCYDTCSDQSETDEVLTESYTNLTLKVEVGRLNKSTFERYFKKHFDDENSDYSSDEDISSDEVKNITTKEGINAGNLEYLDNNENVGNEDNLSNRDIQDNIILSSSEGDYVDSNSNDEEKCISFVTTRRRNEVVNDSFFVLDNTVTVCSPSGSDCDKTVISVNTGEKAVNSDLNETHAPNTLDIKLKEWNTIQMERKTCKKETNLRSSVTTRKSRKSRESMSHDDTMKSDVQDAIVLKPGKKWQRSLSIFRRMTQITDHFDQSIIDEECAHKGRNYRQSVINTMESQDLGSVHNVSISSRRSTFISKPSRSTVRIIKDTSNSRLSATSVFDDLEGFLHEDCDDTVVELSKLSLADSDREISVVENFNECDRGLHDVRGTTARDYVLRRCNQPDVILFDECYPETDLKNCHKIGEGVYGEVFLWRARDGRARVMKIIPIAGSTKVNGEQQKDYQEVIAEIVIAMELSALRSPLADIERLDEGRDIESLDLHAIDNATDVFNEVLGVRCVYGQYPSRLLDLWELYDEVKGSENDNPAILPPDQQFIVLELANAGQDLESYQFNSAEQAHALFWQVAFGLAVGEEAFQFEHRDLHWGNVLIAPTDQKLATFVLRGRTHRVPRCGVAASVIDYSLSRISLPLPLLEVALYNDLAGDSSLFSAVGDYQFEVYRRMRDKLGNEWKNFEPYTNILWLHYTVDKMITALRYKRTNTKIHKHYIAKLKGIKNRILQYGSACQFVLTDNEI